MYKRLVFDVDGTIIDANKPILLGIQEAWEEVTGQRKTLEDFQFTVGIPTTSTLDQLEYQGDYLEFTRLWVKKIQTYSHEIKVFHGIQEVLEELKMRKVPMGVVTSRTTDQLKEVFDVFKLWPYFDYMVTADMTMRHKPRPEPMLKLLELSKNHGKDVLYIGDTMHDIQCAHSAGTDSALAMWGNVVPTNEQATYVLKDPLEVLDLVSQ